MSTEPLVRPVKGKALKELREKASEFFRRAIENGEPLTAYICEHEQCHSTQTAIKPTRKLVGSKGYWDGAKTCTACGCTNFVKVWPTGKTEAIKM